MLSLVRCYLQVYLSETCGGGQNLLASTAETVIMAPAETQTYKLEECKAHTSDKDCWLVIHGKVYDVTDFLEEHPGGYDIILTSAGQYCSLELSPRRP